MGRLSAVERDALAADQRRFHDAVGAIRRRPVSGPFIVLMNSSPDLAARFAHLGHYFHARGQADESVLPLRVRAFISLVGSRALDAPYEWGAWVNWALDAGVPQDKVDAIREGKTPAGLTAEEALLIDFCTQLVSGNHRLSEPTFKAALDQFGVQGLVELAVTLGYFAMIALPLNAFESEMSSEQKGLRKPFAPLLVKGLPWTGSATTRANLPPLSGNSAALPRITLLATHEDVAPEHQHFLDRIVRTRGGIFGVFQVLMHTPDAAERIAHIGAFFLYESILPPAIRALIGLIAARELDSPYTWRANVTAARVAGIAGGLIEALEHGKTLSGVTVPQQVLLDFCYQLLRGNHHVDDTTYRAAVAQWGIAASVQIAATLGYMVMMSVVANVFDIAPQDDDSRPAL